MSRDEYKSLERWIWKANFILLALVLFCSFSCSSTERIAQATTQIQENSQSSLSRFILIGEEAAAPAPDLALIQHEAVGGQGEQETILSLTQDVHTVLPHVQDKTPYWANLLQYMAIAVIVVAVFLILWYTGIGSLMKRLIGFVPKPKRREADLAASVLDDASPTTMREWIATRRATDPEFDYAFKEAKRKRLEQFGAIRSNERSSSGIRPVDAGSISGDSSSS